MLLFEYKANIEIDKIFKKGIAKVIIIAANTKPLSPKIEALRAKNT